MPFFRQQENDLTPLKTLVSLQDVPRAVVALGADMVAKCNTIGVGRAYSPIRCSTISLR
jgi:hypothetical protein